MKRCIIVGAGDYFGIPIEITEEDYIIAADAGYKNLKKSGIHPDLLVGDFDSMHIDGVAGTTGPVRDLDIYEDAEKAEYLHHLKQMEVDGIETKVIDPIKNDPDMMACVRLGLEQGFTEFHIIGGTGKRIDHSIANLQILGFLASRGCRGFIYNEFQIITAIHNETQKFPLNLHQITFPLVVFYEPHLYYFRSEMDVYKWHYSTFIHSDIYLVLFVVGAFLILNLISKLR
jgi:thiamine pyrophosphokinase